MPNYQNPMLRFFFYKRCGYQEDCLENTHPVVQDIESTATSTEIFDSITYSKGAAILKQLVFFIGEENFSKTMSLYFQKF